jgi:Cu(I)/Ag(I) efflux system membrane protein CusA/SilA
MKMTERRSFLESVVAFCLQKRLVVFLLLSLFIGWGVLVAPFDWRLGGILRDPVPVDALPDIGENQQIVFTMWTGRSPQDVEDQITYPLTTALMGIQGLRTIRSFSFFGFSSIYLIFRDDMEFYASRSRILEKLNSLPPALLPNEVKPSLGPDSTGLGQVYWYTLEGRDAEGKPAGGWDLHELRRVQDWYLRYALQSVAGVSEVSSIGGFVQEYQVEADPERMRVYGISLGQLYEALRASNQEVGARTLEINRVEYVIRARGYIKQIKDIEDTVVRAKGGTPILVRDIARVVLGPAPRRGALDKDGAEAVGGVVVARYGANPLAVIKEVKRKIQEISAGLPQKRLADGRISKITVVPFYDRSDLIYETLATLEEAISLEILVTILVVIVMLMHLGSSLLIAGTLPLAVLMCFIAMRLAGVDANLVALSGIAIAIGTMVDMGIVLSENIVQALEEPKPEETPMESILRATVEVGSAVVTAVATTVISFLPVFAMEASEGKLFRPLAFTKTFALLASLVVALTLLPPLALTFFRLRSEDAEGRRFWRQAFAAFGDLLMVIGGSGLFAILPAAWRAWLGGALIFLGVWRLTRRFLGERWQRRMDGLGRWLVALLVLLLLTKAWMPLEYEQGFLRNLVFVFVLVGGLLGLFSLFRLFYTDLLRFFLRRRWVFLGAPLLLCVLGLSIWLGFAHVFSWLPPTLAQIGIAKETTQKSSLWANLSEAFPGLKREFMPDLDEGSFLLMPTTMPHASMGEVLDVLRKLDLATRSVPEVSQVVGKLGRVESAMDPAPISMFENVIHFKAKYRILPDGRRIRQWRPQIHKPQDIWDAIVEATKIPGTTSAPLLQPIKARIVMLQSGMRAPMGIKVRAPNLKTLEETALALEKLLKEVPQIEAATVAADRVVGKPYLEFIIDRRAIARYGLKLAQVQRVIEMAIGGARVTTTIEGRERYDVILRYPRELRNQWDTLKRIMVDTPQGTQIPISQIASLRYQRGPQSIKSEDTFLTAYVLFDRKSQYNEIEAVEAAKAYLERKQKEGLLSIPAGVSYLFAGTYQDQIRAEKRLAIVLPLALLLIVIILYLQFGSFSVTWMIFSGILVAWAGGFLMLWLYAQPWFLDISIWGASMREIFRIQPYAMSVAIWVGFIALFGIASDDGVVMATYLEQSFQEKKPQSVEEIREATIFAGERRIRPCLMTTATTLLALLPVLSSSGRGADIMIPMAIPSFGGMLIELLTLFLVPVLYAWREERKLKRAQKKGRDLPMAAIAASVAFLFILPSGSGAWAQSMPPVKEKIAAFPAMPPTLREIPDAAMLWKMVKKNNPTLKRLQQQLGVAAAKVKQAGAWPDLEIGVQASNFSLPTFEPTMMTGIEYSVSQRFPILSRLQAQKDIAKAEIHKLQSQILEERLSLAYNLRETLLALYDLREQWRFQAEAYAITTQALAIARIRYALNKAKKQDLLQAFVLLARLRQQALLLELKAKTFHHTLQQLAPYTQATSSSTTSAPSEKSIPSEKLAATTPSEKSAASVFFQRLLPSASLPQSVQEVLERAHRARPILRFWQIDDRQSTMLLQLARAQYWPDVMVRLSFRQRFPNSMDQGEPFLSLGIQIPLPTWGNPARQGLAEEAAARRLTAKMRIRETLSGIRKQAQDALATLQNLKQQQELYQKQLLPLAEESYKASLASYQVGQEDFLSLLQNLRVFLQNRLESLRLSIQATQTRLRLHSIAGDLSI